jgi:hypothetical protein
MLICCLKAQIVCQFLRILMGLRGGIELLPIIFLFEFGFNRVKQLSPFRARHLVRFPEVIAFRIRQPNPLALHISHGLQLTEQLLVFCKQRVKFCVHVFFSSA